MILFLKQNRIFEQIEKWYEDGVPLAVVLDGISAFIEKKRKAKRGGRGFLLTAAASSVKKLFKDYQILHEGEGESGDEERDGSEEEGGKGEEEGGS